MAKRIVDEAEREYQHEYQAIYRRTAKARAAHQTYKRKHDAKYPDQKRAIRKLAIAIRNGSLKRRPCEVCGAADKIEAHHDDYSQPLDVRWLCERHHKEHHTKMRSLM